ncbi:MAG TPA: hypothetical protein VFQ35_00420 [Polyangiaceae bacterium]|nr:hypothetical protein [Polyangiaceae bacterium]
MLRYFVFVCGALVAACSSGDSGSNGGGDSTGKSEAQWPGDPCTLLTSADFAGLPGSPTISKSEAHDLMSQQFSPTCYFYVKGDTVSDTLHLAVDPEADFDLQQTLFKAQPVSGIGKAAWHGNNGGVGNLTVGVLVDGYSFRIDSTSEYEYPELDVLAKLIAPRIK